MPPAHAETAAKAQAANAPAILLLGDSMMKVGVAPVLRRELASRLGADVTVHAKSSTGLARPDTFDWPAELKGLLADRHFDRAVVYLGTNDCQMLTGGGAKVAYGTPAWEKAYRERVHGFLDQLCAGANEVLWLELPPMRSTKFNSHIAALNQLLASEVKASACARFLPLADRLADGKGHYAAARKAKKRWLNLRENDGIHLTQTAGQLVTEAVLAAWRK